jgi:hypothetical protein
MAASHHAFLVIGSDLAFIGERAAPEWRPQLYEALRSLRTWLGELGAEGSELGLEVAGWLDKLDRGAEMDYERLRRKARAGWWDAAEELAREHGA